MKTTVKVPYERKEDNVKFVKREGVDDNLKDIAMMEYQADLKDKKENKKEYKDGMRAGFNLAMGQIDSSVK